MSGNKREAALPRHGVPAQAGARGRALGGQDPVERMRLTVILILLVLLIGHQWALVWALDRREKA